MSRKAGYLVINLKAPFTQTNGYTNTQAGIYNLLKYSHVKSVLVCGLKIDGVEYNDVFTHWQVSGDKIKIVCDNISWSLASQAQTKATLTISNNDSISLVA